jgi:hypothetical protein
MSFQLGFRDHEGFHRAALWMTAGGALAGLAAGLAGAGITGTLYAGATGAVLGAGLADRKAGLTRLALRAGFLALAVGAFVAVRGLAGGHAGVLALAAVLGFALNLGVSGWRAVAAIAVGGGIAYLGAYAAGEVMIAQETEALPDTLEAVLASTAMAMVSVAALLPRHVVVARVRRAAGLDPEVRALVARGDAVWKQVGGRLDPEGNALLRDGVTRLHDLADRWSRVDRPSESRETLEARIKDLDARVEATRDDVARAQYREARAAVEDQLRLVDSIEQSRERVLARLHACVTTLEKFRLAAANLDGKDASRRLLTDATADIAACGEAMSELGA